MNFDEAKAYAQSDINNGTNLYDHLVSLVERILTEKPANPLDIVENTSALVKRSKYVTSKDTEGALIDVEPANASTVSQNACITKKSSFRTFYFTFPMHGDSVLFDMIMIVYTNILKH